MFPHEFVWPQQLMESHKTSCLHQMQDVQSMAVATILQPYSSRGLGVTRRKTHHCVPLPGCRACGIAQLLSFQRCSKKQVTSSLCPQTLLSVGEVGKTFFGLTPCSAKEELSKLDQLHGRGF